jgi:nucleotide-binding universal stress UspA family protein
MSTDLDYGPGVVVGIDGSEESVQALRWAVRYAEAFGHRVTAVIAWRPVSLYGYQTVVGSKGQDEFAGETVRDAVAKVLADGSEVAVDRRVRRGVPAEVMVEESRGADLLVIGSRGLGAFSGMLLGSVSNFCIHHALCPVVVVPSHRKPTQASPSKGEEET